MASRWVLWLTQKDTLSNGVLSLPKGVCRCWLVSPSPSCSALWVLGLAFCKLHSVSPLYAGFLLGASIRDTGESLKGRAKGLAPSCLLIVLVKNPSFWHRLWVPASNFWGALPAPASQPPHSEVFVQLRRPLL